MKSAKSSKVLGIVGVTGLVGQAALELLENEKFKFDVQELKVFASHASVGKVIFFNGHKTVIEKPNLESLLKCDAVLFASDASVSLEFIPILSSKGIVCVDKSSAYRMDANVPLVVPEVNAYALKNLKSDSNIVASPNCVAIPLVVVAHAVEKQFGLKHMVVSTYQSVSGSGKAAIDVLLKESQEFLHGQDLKCTKSTVYPKSIAFNVIPFIESLTDEGHTGEEVKILNETKKILNNSALPIDVTSVRVPTFVGHAMSVTFETQKPFEKKAFMENLGKQKGIKLTKESDFCTPREAQGKNDIFVSRVRATTGFKNGVSLWITCDNLRKGAALNALQVIECMLTRNI